MASMSTKQEDHLRTLETACSLSHIDSTDTSRFPHTEHRGAFVDCPALACQMRRSALDAFRED